MNAPTINFAVSTLAFIGESPERIVELAIEHGFTLEFSSGMPYRPDMEEFYLNAPVKRLPHNYFPAPEHPFVLNLASDSELIREMSVAHCIRGLQLAAQSDAPFFSAHAGFCIDPRPEQLGKALDVNVVFDREKHWDLFIGSVKKICTEAAHLGLRFLIENNVLAPFNLTADKRNPLLCCGPDELLKLAAVVNSPHFGLLLDTAHLKVSAKTLGFDMRKVVQQLKGQIYCIHHSDNDGANDSNEMISPGYWFLEFVREFKTVLHVLEVKKIHVEDVFRQKTLLQKAVWVS